MKGKKENMLNDDALDFVAGGLAIDPRLLYETESPLTDGPLKNSNKPGETNQEKPTVTIFDTEPAEKPAST